MSVLQVALLSAKTRAPSLVPVVILMASDEAAHIKATRRRLMDAGAVAVLPHKISFHDNIIKAAGPSRSWVQGAVGSYLRLDVPTFMPEVRSVLTNLNVQLDYILWTDPGECLLWAPIPNNAQHLNASKSEIHTCTPPYNQLRLPPLGIAPSYAAFSMAMHSGHRLSHEEAKRNLSVSLLQMLYSGKTSIRAPFQSPRCSAWAQMWRMNRLQARA